MKSKKGRKGSTGERRQPKSTRLCPECGSMLASNGQLCANCGLKIGGKQLRTLEAQPTPSTPAPKLVGEKVLAFTETHEVERKYVTILIADIADYASLSQKLSPEEQYRVVSHCLALLQEQVFRYGGTMTQTTKGTIKAVFGAPQSFERHANRACEAALSITKLISDYSKRLREDHGLEIQMRIGLVSGIILSGSMPRGADINYEDLEDVDDLIPTVQAALRPGTAVVTGSTYKFVSNVFEFRPLEGFAPLGAGPCVEMFELLCSRQFLGPIESKQLRGLSKFVGRGPEMSILLEASEEARKGTGQAIAIVGEAGVGKSRLVFEFKNSFPPEERSWLDGYCRSYDGVPPYHPFLDILKLSFAIEPQDKETSIKKKILRKIRRLFDSYEEIVGPLHEIMALTVENERYLALSFREKRKRVFKAVEKVLVGESSDKPLVLVLEDLHWIDRTSEQLLAHLMSRISEAKILLIVLCRPEYEGAIRLSPSLRTIRLGELEEGPMRALTSSVLKGSEVDNGVVDVIRDKTGGNPLFIEEFAMSLRESDAIREVDGKFFLRNEAQSPLMPQTIQSVISARIDRLEKEVKATLQVASVIGREVPFRLLEQVRKAGRSIEPDMVKLQQLEFMHEKVESAEREYVFKHVLTQEAAYGGMSRQKRTLIHKEVGNAVEEMFAERIEDFYEQLAYHFSRAGNKQKEIQYLQLSAIKAKKQNSLWEAYGFAKEAIRCLKEEPPSRKNKELEIEVLAILNQVLRMLDYAPHDSELLMLRGEDLALELMDRRGLSLFRACLCSHYLAVGDGNSCREYSERLSKEIEASEDVLLAKDQLRIVVPIAIELSIAGLSGLFSESLSLNLTVLKSMEEAHATVDTYDAYDPSIRAYPLLAGLSAAFSAMLGDFDNAVILCRKALEVALEMQDPHAISLAEFYNGLALTMRGVGDESIQFLQRSIQRWQSAHSVTAFSSTQFLSNAESALGYAKFLVEDFQGARECFKNALERQLDKGIVFYLAWVYTNLSMLHLATGDLKSAEDCIKSALEWSQKSGEKHWEGLSKILQGKILCASELLQAAKAESCILEGIEILTEFGMKPYCAQGHLYLGELYLGTGRTQQAAKNLKKAERMFRHMGMEYWLRKTEEVLGRLQIA